MFEVTERKMIVPNLHLLTVQAPEIVEEIKPGQFVIVRSHSKAERIPLSVADWDNSAGTLTIIFMEVGESTGKLASLKPGDSIPTVVGPLGKPTEIDKYGTVVCIGGCYGIASIFPTLKALHQNRIIPVVIKLLTAITVADVPEVITSDGMISIIPGVEYRPFPLFTWIIQQGNKAHPIQFFSSR